jgi:hypothetical protein
VISSLLTGRVRSRLVAKALSAASIPITGWLIAGGI